MKMTLEWWILSVFVCACVGLLVWIWTRRTPSAEQVRQAALAAMDSVEQSAANRRDAIDADLDDLERRFAEGAQGFAEDTDMKLLWYAATAKVSTQQREALDEYLRSRGNRHLPGPECWEQLASHSRKGTHGRKVTASAMECLQKIHRRLGGDGVIEPLAIPSGDAVQSQPNTTLVKAGNAAAMTGLMASVSAGLSDGIGMEVTEKVLEVIEDAALDIARELLVQEFGEEVEEELVEVACGLLFPGLGLVFAAWKTVKYGAKIKRFFYDKEPLIQMQEAMNKEIRQQGVDLSAQLRTQLVQDQQQWNEAVMADIRRWEQEALVLVAARAA